MRRGRVYVRVGRTGSQAVAFLKARVRDIRTGCVVTCVDYTSRDSVSVTYRSRLDAASSGVLRVDRVVVAVPLQILKDGDIAFVPAMPSGEPAAPVLAKRI